MWLMQGTALATGYFFPCRAVVAHKGKVIPLSRDFTPETERQRVRSAYCKNHVCCCLSEKSIMQKCD